MAKRLGLPWVSSHCLRHSYASLLLQDGEPPQYVQQQLGHASIQTTVDTYGRWLKMGNRGAVDRLAARTGYKTVTGAHPEAVAVGEVVAFPERTGTNG
jgi:integrase